MNNDEETILIPGTTKEQLVQLEAAIRKNIGNVLLGESDDVALSKYANTIGFDSMYSYVLYGGPKPVSAI